MTKKKRTVMEIWLFFFFEARKLSLKRLKFGFPLFLAVGLV